MATSKVAKFLQDSKNTLAEVGGFLAQAEESGSRNLLSKSLSMIDSVIQNIKNYLQSEQTSYQEKMQLVELRDSARSLAYLIQLSEGDLESVWKIGSSIPLEKLEFPTFSLALKAIPIFLQGKDWKWDALSNIIKKFDDDLTKEAKASNRFDLWLLVFFSGVLSHDSEKIGLACPYLANPNFLDIELLLKLAKALADREAGRILSNTESESIEYYQDKATASKAIEENPEKYSGWSKTCQIYFSNHEVGPAHTAYKLARLAGEPYSEFLAKKIETKKPVTLSNEERRRMVQGFRELQEFGEKSESSLMRGFAMVVKEAGGPEGLATWWDEVGSKIPAFQRDFMRIGERKRYEGPADCPRCRIIIEEKARELALKPFAKKNPVICPLCGAEIIFK